MKAFCFLVMFVVVVCGACDDEKPAQNPTNGSASSEPASTSKSHTPSHGQFNGP